MCHGDAARDVNPVEINLVEEEELRHTAGCDARNPSPCGGRITRTARHSPRTEGRACGVSLKRETDANKIVASEAQAQ